MSDTPESVRMIAAKMTVTNPVDLGAERALLRYADLLERLAMPVNCYELATAATKYIWAGPEANTAQIRAALDSYRAALMEKTP